jgi:hypothetical protein
VFRAERDQPQHARKWSGVNICRRQHVAKFAAAGLGDSRVNKEDSLIISRAFTERRLGGFHIPLPDSALRARDR